MLNRVQCAMCNAHCAVCYDSKSIIQFVQYSAAMLWSKSVKCPSAPSSLHCSALDSTAQKKLHCSAVHCRKLHCRKMQLGRVEKNCKNWTGRGVELPIRAISVISYLGHMRIVILTSITSIPKTKSQHKNCLICAIYLTWEDFQCHTHQHSITIAVDFVFLFWHFPTLIHSFMKSKADKRQDGPNVKTRVIEMWELVYLYKGGLP